MAAKTCKYVRIFRFYTIADNVVNEVSEYEFDVKISI